MRILIVICMLVLSVSILLAQGLQDWQTITYMNDVSDMVFSDGDIWISTSGGVYKYNILDSADVKYTNTDGLGSLDLSSIEKDHYNHIIASSKDGTISMYSENVEEWSVYNNLSGTEIVDLYSIADTLWVATTTGVGVFLIEENSLGFRDYYDNLPIEPGKAYRITVFNNRVYYATENGLLHAPSNFIQYNLKLSDNWKVMTSSGGLPSNSVRDLVPILDSLFVATSAGVATILKDGTTAILPSWNSGIVTKMLISGDTRYFIREIDYFKWIEGRWSYIANENIPINSAVLDDKKELWTGRKEGGIKKRTWQNAYKIDGPASNYVGILIKDRRGTLWISSGKFKLSHPYGFYRYDFPDWKNYAFANGDWFRKNSMAYVYEDRNGRIWFGAWGGGVVTVHNEEIDYYHSWTGAGEMTVSTSEGIEEYLLPEIPENKSCLSGANISAADYTVIPCILEDQTGNVWLANHLSRDLKYLAVVPRNSQGELDMDCAGWTYFGSNIGITSTESEISSLAFDDFGRLWIGTFTSGILVYDFNGTIDDRTDDKGLIRVNTSNANLFSNIILTLSKDQDGVMWIGTAGGLNSFDGSSFYKHVGETGPVDNKINQIFVDNFNNKWLATDGGMSVLQSNKSPWDTGAWVHYTTENSGLPAKIVNSIYVDSKNSEAYIGTEGGLSIFSGSFAEYKENLESVVAGPSPFILNGSSQFVIKNLIYGATIKILNMNGRLVRVLSEDNGMVEGGRAVWDGKDENNSKVPSGIYLYMIYNDEGVTGNGKIAVVKP